MSDLPELHVASPGMTEQDADTRIAASHFDIEALAAKADHRILCGDHRAAAAYYSLINRIARDQGPGLAESAPIVRRAQSMVKVLAGLFRKHILDALARVGYPERIQPARFDESLAILLGERPRSPTAVAFPPQPQLYYYPGLPTVDFVDSSVFAWREALEAPVADMREEAARLLAGPDLFAPYVKRVVNRPQGDTHRLIDNPDWSSLELWACGRLVDENAARCPVMVETLRDHVPLSMIANRSPSVYLSLLRPGAHIPPHSGMLNCRYICHLPLIVPPGCRFRVGTRSREWVEGQLLVFDDSVEHEAWNEGTENRLILLFEIWSPNLTDDEKMLIRTLLEAVDSYA